MPSGTRVPRRAVQFRWEGPLDESAGPLRRAFQYAFYDWTREMPKYKRVITTAGILIQGYAVYALWSRSLIWPVIWPQGPLLYAAAFLLYLLGTSLMNGMLTSEFVRKTQLESDQMAARQIQQTLHPEKLDQWPGYELESCYLPFRAVGGDYFDVIGLTGNQTLFAIADVSGKGMAAALLAANIQALVRSIANVVEGDPLELARQINRHLSRYTPSDRFATAVFIVLNRDSGDLTYVNAGHNAPILFASGAVSFLEATGVPLGLFPGAEYQARTAVVPRGGALLLFTDGLTDSIPGTRPEDRLRDALKGDPATTMSNLKSSVDPKFNEDDVTILLVRRRQDAAPSGA